MSLKREYAEKMKRAGFLPFEVRQFAAGKKADGKSINFERICNSKPFEKALESRMEWWQKALSPQNMGGWGYTYKQAEQAIKHHYATTKGRKKSRNFWAFLKLEYRPPQKIQTKRAFTEAVIQKSKIARDMGTYSTKLRHKRSPVLPGRCSLCRGVGELQNISGQRQTCPRCGGTGRSGRPRE